MESRGLYRSGKYSYQFICNQKTWGFTKSNQRFLENLNAAKEYIEEVGIEKAYQEAKETMGIELEFDSMNINKEFGFGEREGQ